MGLIGSPVWSGGLIAGSWLADRVNGEIYRRREIAGLFGGVCGSVDGCE